MLGNSEMEGMRKKAVADLLKRAPGWTQQNHKVPQPEQSVSPKCKPNLYRLGSVKQCRTWPVSRPYTDTELYGARRETKSRIQLIK
jgi:hypothetical protein